MNTEMKRKKNTKNDDQFGLINLAHTIPFFLYEKGKSKKINEFNNFLKLAIIKLVWFSENLWESREKNCKLFLLFDCLSEN